MTVMSPILLSAEHGSGKGYRMKSGIRVFKDRGITARGNLLSRGDFRLNRDIAEEKIRKESGDFFVAQAEEMLEEEIPFLPLSLYRDFSLTAVRSRFERKHHRRRAMLLSLTLAEAYERKGRFVEKIADVLWAILEETTWVLPAHCYHSTLMPGTGVPEIYDETQMPGLDLYAANCCAAVALTKYLLKEELDAISPVICKRVEHLVYLRGVRPFASVPYGWSGEFGGNCNNWVTNITSNILLACALCTEDMELRTRVADRAMRYLDNFTACYPEDGSCDEGPGYWSGAGGNYFDCLELLDDMSGGKIQVYDHPLVRKMGEYIADVHIAGKYFLNFSDAHPKIEPEGKLIVRYGEKCGSPELYSFGRMAAAVNSRTRGRFFGMAYRVNKDALIPEITEAEEVKAKKQHWFDGNKIAVFRENARAGDGLFLAVKGGNNNESHNHNDVGCFVVYADGKPLIVDPSHGSYDNGFFGPTRYGRWYMKSSYHNIPTVDGIVQKNGGEFASSEEIFDGVNNTVSLELKNAFPKEAGILSMRRSCTLDDGEIRVTDAVKLDHEGEISFNYLCVDEPKQLSPGRLALSAEREFLYDPDGVELVLEKVENTWLPYEDLNFRSNWDRDCLWRICLLAKSAEKTVTVTVR